MNGLLSFLINQVVTLVLSLLQNFGLPALVTELQALAVKYPDFSVAINALIADLTNLEAKKEKP